MLLSRHATVKQKILRAQQSLWITLAWLGEVRGALAGFLGCDTISPSVRDGPRRQLPCLSAIILAKSTALWPLRLRSSTKRTTRL
jgi:hypothetical protein